MIIQCLSGPEPFSKIACEIAEFLLAPGEKPEPVGVCTSMTVKQAEQLLIEATIRHTAGNIKQAAKILGLDRSTLYEKLNGIGATNFGISSRPTGPGSEQKY